MTLFRIDVSRETGAVMLWMQAPCGFKPIIGWAHLDGVKEFAEMLLDFYNTRKEERDEVKRGFRHLIETSPGQ